MYYKQSFLLIDFDYLKKKLIKRQSAKFSQKYKSQLEQEAELV